MRKLVFLNHFSRLGGSLGQIETGKGQIGTIGSLPTFFGMVPQAIEQHEVPYRIVSECWPGANVIGKVPIPAIDCFSHFSPLEEGLGLVDRRCLLLTCDYLATSEAWSGSEMRINYCILWAFFHSRSMRN